MIQVLATLTFFVVAATSWWFQKLIPKWIFDTLEHFLVIVGFIGVISALSQMSSDSRETEALSSAVAAKELFGSMLQRIEYRMNECDVWWDTVLDQTNRNPEACRATEECADACRMAHFVSQYRWRPIDAKVGTWDNFNALVCATGSYEHYGTVIEEPTDPMCEPATRFLSALEAAQEAKRAASNQLLSNHKVLIVIQFLVALGLGLEVGKLRASRAADPVS